MNVLWIIGRVGGLSFCSLQHKVPMLLYVCIFYFCISACMTVCKSLCLRVCLYVSQSLSQSVCLFDCLSLSVCLSVYFILIVVIITYLPDHMHYFWLALQAAVAEGLVSASARAGN